MQKIMFNDKFGLTQAVLEGRKTMTRRIIKGKWFWERCPEGMWTSDEIKAWEKECEQRLIELSQTEEWVKAKEWAISHIANYKIGEVVAVNQSYKEIASYPYFISQCAANEQSVNDMMLEKGWNNKMFVAAYYMPHHIRITDIRCERLQEISDEDCLNEGISRCCEYYECSRGGYIYDTPLWEPEVCPCFGTPQEAFASLIDKVSGKGTWERNPYVFAYSFELVK